MILYFKIKTLSACMCDLMLVVISVETTFVLDHLPQNVLQTAPDRTFGDTSASYRVWGALLPSRTPEH
jgi:hypothetical protein